MICRTLVASSHDACPNSGRARPPEWQGHMGELYHLMVKVTQVQRRLSRCHRWIEVRSGADKVFSWLEVDHRNLLLTKSGNVRCDEKNFREVFAPRSKVLIRPNSSVLDQEDLESVGP